MFSLIVHHLHASVINNRSSAIFYRVQLCYAIIPLEWRSHSWQPWKIEVTGIAVGGEEVVAITCLQILFDTGPKTGWTLCRELFNRIKG